MGPARTITLFAPPPRPGSGSSSWMASLAVHAAVCGWLFYGLVHAPYVQRRTLHQRFMVRELNVPMTQPEVLRYAATGSPVHPAAQSAAHDAHSITAPAFSAAAPAPAPQKMAAATPSGPPAAPSQERPAPALPAAVQIPQLAHQQQTLIQPDAPKDLILERPTPIPLVMMWEQQEPPRPTVASPPPKPAVANLHSSIARPNREAAPAPINLSSTNFHSAMPTIAPGTTSPVVVRGPDAARQMPTVAAPSNTPPAPVRIISLSDRQQVEGPVAVPLANASAPPSTSQSLTAGKSENASPGTGRGNSSNQTNAAQTSQNLGSAGKQPGATGPAGQGTARASNSAGAGGPQTSAPAGSAPGTGASTAAGAAQGPAAPGSGPGIGSENPASVKRITMPKDGQFGVVVVGSSLADQYPETAAIWAGRLVYTVYLHVGMGKSWILQYSLPAGSQAAATGARPDAPWPYDIVVPRLDAGDYNSDALMVHGFVNDSGHFERLNVVLPPQFAQSKFVLSALEQWQFRAARQNGQSTQVEILLIIPEQDE